MLRVPLWDPAARDSREFLGDRAKQIQVLESHELAAGKLAALLARGASRDLFDARQLLANDTFDQAMLRLASVVYGGLNRVHWSTISTESVTATVDDVKRQLVPMLHQDIRPPASTVERWTGNLIEETRALLGAVLPLAEHELEFIERLNGQGEIEPSLLTSDADLQQRIAANPALRWKALNVKKHVCVD
jgi:hypothetical protein